MEPARTILLAASPGGAREIRAALRDSVDYEVVLTFEEAVEALERQSFRLIILGYYFDRSHPARFLTHARAQSPLTPIILVRALGFPLGTTSEAEIAAAYQALGVNEFIDLADLMSRLGVEKGRQLFRETVLRRVGERGPEEPVG